MPLCKVKCDRQETLEPLSAEEMHLWCYLQLFPPLIPELDAMTRFKLVNIQRKLKRLHERHQSDLNLN